MSQKWALLCGIAMLGSSTNAAAAEEEATAAAFEKIAAGHKIMAAAELGTTNDMLGEGFKEDLTSYGADSGASRVYPAKLKEVLVDQYEVQFETIENALQLDAHARYLFVRAGVKKREDRRYMVLRVSHIDKVAMLEHEGPSAVESDLYISKIFYGWALYVVIEGTKTSFTVDVAAGLRNAGAALKDQMQSHKLSSHVHTIGLRPKNVGEVVIATTPEEITQSFQTPEVSAPIFVEYTARRDMAVRALPWTRATLRAGQYRVNVSVEVLSNKADGRSWDGLGGPPDPVVSLYIDGQLVASCKQQDSLINSCLQDKVVTLHEESTFMLQVVDKDVSDDDYIGKTEPYRPVVSHADLHKPAYLETQGQISNAKLTFLPLQ